VGKNQTALKKEIAELKQRLTEARARIPKHDVPPALMAEVDEMEEELAALQAQLKPKTLEEQIADVEQRLADARARIPAHTPPAALMAEIDELEERLAELQAKQ
jgi:polyhydroxyalkanoate synthesis regulator phasin